MARVAMNSDEIQAAAEELTPFTESFEIGMFFPAIGCLNLLSGIRQNIVDSMPVVVLTGDAGSGKSVMGRMLVAEDVSGCMFIYFDKTVESFENVVHMAASRVGVEVTDVSRAGIAKAIEEIAGALADRKQRLVLVCDGAERIYLATLERIRKMLDRLNTDSVHMQVVLIGRKGLIDNLRQLSICNFEEAPEKCHIMQPLSKSETISYLKICATRLPKADSGLFTPELMDRIWQESSGNFSKIKRFAEEVRKQHSPDASFWVLLENVEGRKPASITDRCSWLTLLNPRRYTYTTFAAAAVSVVLGLVLIAFVTNSSDDEAGIGVRTAAKEATVPDKSLVTLPETRAPQAAVDTPVNEEPGLIEGPEDADYESLIQAKLDAAAKGNRPNRQVGGEVAVSVDESGQIADVAGEAVAHSERIEQKDAGVAEGSTAISQVGSSTGVEYVGSGENVSGDVSGIDLFKPTKVAVEEVQPLIHEEIVSGVLLPEDQHATGAEVAELSPVVKKKFSMEPAYSGNRRSGTDVPVMLASISKKHVLHPDFSKRAESGSNKVVSKLQSDTDKVSVPVIQRGTGMKKLRVVALQQPVLKDFTVKEEAKTSSVIREAGVTVPDLQVSKASLSVQSLASTQAKSKKLPVVNKVVLPEKRSQVVQR